MSDAVTKVEKDITDRRPDLSTETIQIPTLLNDALSPACVCVAVTPNFDEACCFRGMECAQFELLGKIYNIAILRKQPKK